MSLLVLGEAAVEDGLSGLDGHEQVPIPSTEIMVFETLLEFASRTTK